MWNFASDQCAPSLHAEGCESSSGFNFFQSSQCHSSWKTQRWAQCPHCWSHLCIPHTKIPILAGCRSSAIFPAQTFVPQQVFGQNQVDVLHRCMDCRPSYRSFFDKRVVCPGIRRNVLSEIATFDVFSIRKNPQDQVSFEIELDVGFVSFITVTAAGESQTDINQEHTDMEKQYLTKTEQVKHIYIPPKDGTGTHLLLLKISGGAGRWHKVNTFLQ